MIITKLLGLFKAPNIIVNPVRQAQTLRPPVPSLELDEKLKVTVGLGNPYETKIVRRREVTDISMPDFEKQECLKWAKWSMLRNVKRRHLLMRYWQYRTNLKNIATCRTLPSVLRDAAFSERISNTPRQSSVNQIHNHCSLTSRSRGIYYKYKLSRMVWRDMADHGLVSGAIRAKWS